MNNDIYKRLFSQAPFGYSYQKIVFDKTGKAVDTIFFEVNAVFEKITGLKSAHILNRNASEISPKSNIDDLEQMGLMIDAALNGKEYTYEYFSKYTRKHYNVQVYSVEKDFFTRLFVEMPEEKHAALTSAAQEDKYYRLIEFAVDAFFHGDCEGNFITVNAAAEELTGYSRDELLNMNIVDMFPEDTLKSKPLRFDLLETGQTLITERDALKKNGEIIPIEMYSKKMPDGSYQAFARDITHRKSAEKNLMLYQEALDSATDAIGMSTPEGKHYYQNNSFTRLFGNIGDYPPDTLYVDKKIGIEVFHTIMAGERWTGEVEMYAADKRILKILLRAYAGKDSAGRITALVGIHTDITRQKMIENTIKESERRFNAMLSVIPDMISVHDREMNIVYSNWNGFAQVETEKRLYNTKCYQTYRGMNDICPDCQAKKVFQTRKPFSVETQIPDGRWFDIRVIPVLFEGDEVSLFMEWVRDITDLKLVHQALEEKTLELERYFTLALDLFCIADTDGNFIRLNKQWEQVLGYTVEELKSRKFFEFIHPDDYQPTMDVVSKLHSQNQVYNFVNRYRKKDGTYCWIEWHSNPLGNQIYAVARDITERMRTEEALKLERSQLLSIFDSIDEIIYVTDPNTYEVLFANLAMKKAFNRELVGGICYQEFQGLDAPCPFCTNEIILHQKPEPYCWEYHNPTVNTDFAIVDRIIKWTDGRDVRFELAINITERKLAEKQLIEKNQFISSLLRAIPVAVFYKDKEGRYLGCNNLFSEIIGVTSSEIQGKTVYELWPGELAEVYHQKDIEIIRNPHAQNYEFKVKDKNGKIRPVIFAKDTFSDASGEIAGLVGAFLDITELKETEDALINAKEKAEESDHLKSAFLANLSHEIRTPMNAILGFTELLKISPLETEKKEQYIEIILKSGKRLLSIISDIIEISKIDAGQMKLNFSTIDINSMLLDLYNEIYVIIPKDKNVTLQILEKKPNLKIKSDEVKLKQILTNLITNAVKFTENGVITFGCKEIHQDTGLIEFVVQDTGCGIDKKYHQTIFERFRQGEGDLTIIKGGSGLGLAISKSYVEMLGGTIGVESELGKGSLFSFTIALKMAENILVQSDVQSELLTIKPKKLSPILIAEDDEDNYYFIQEIMKLEHFPILRAKNGQEAVDICRINDDIRIVLMDIQMPIMDGYAALKEIRKIRPGLTIIAQTAFALSGDKEHVISAGFDGYITKPINISELFKILNSCNCI